MIVKILGVFFAKFIFGEVLTKTQVIRTVCKMTFPFFVFNWKIPYIATPLLTMNMCISLLKVILYLLLSCFVFETAILSFPPIFVYMIIGNGSCSGIGYVELHSSQWEAN